MDHPAANEIADLVGGEFLAGEYTADSGHCGSGLGIDRFDGRVRVRRADEISVGLAGPADIVGGMALAGDEPLVFLAAHCGADPGRTHGSLLPRFSLLNESLHRSAAIRRLSQRRRGPPWRAHLRRSP